MINEAAKPSSPADCLEFLDQIENMARQHCFTDKVERIFQGVREVNATDSNSLSSDAEALRTLAQQGRFRIVRQVGRMVVGYWPENDPNAAPHAEATNGRR